ncbi:hypothetical protein M9Y10_041379 [Tritrichomonas musculus]|uniref:Uncharacterized protein n=1 Tax=Tritrichomonas musculus TaxID=1915356 RepID=A0ABR2K584_9EUKA
MVNEIEFTTKTIDTIELIIDDHLEWSTKKINSVDKLLDSLCECLVDTNYNLEFKLHNVINYYNIDHLKEL